MCPAPRGGECEVSIVDATARPCVCGEQSSTAELPSRKEVVCMYTETSDSNFPVFILPTRMVIRVSAFLAPRSGYTTRDVDNFTYSWRKHMHPKSLRMGCCLRFTNRGFGAKATAVPSPGRNLVWTSWGRGLLPISHSSDTLMTTRYSPCRMAAYASGALSIPSNTTVLDTML